MITSMFTGSLAHNGFMGIPAPVSPSTPQPNNTNRLLTIPSLLAVGGLSVSTLFLPSAGHAFETPQHDPKAHFQIVSTIVNPEGNRQIGFGSNNPTVVAERLVAAAEGSLKIAMAAGEYGSDLAGILVEIAPEEAVPQANATPEAEKITPEVNPEKKTPKGLMPGILASLALLAGGFLTTIPFVRFRRLRKQYDKKLGELQTHIVNNQKTLKNIERGNESNLDTWLQELKDVENGPDLIQQIKDGKLKEMLANTTGQTQEKVRLFIHQEENLLRDISLFEEKIASITKDLEQPHFKDRKKLASVVNELTALNMEKDLDLKRNLQELRFTWHDLIRAVKAMSSTAEKDFSDNELELLKTNLEQANLKTSFLHEHPLYENKGAAYERLNSLRESDPDAYNARIQKYRAQEDQIKKDVDALITTLDEMRDVTRLLKSLRTISDDETTVSARHDPIVPKGRGDHHTKNLSGILLVGRDLKGAVAKSSAALAEYKKAYELKSALIDAIENARTRVREAEATFLTTYKRLTLAIALANELKEVHDKASRAPLMVEVMEAQSMLRKLGKLFKAIRQYLPRENDPTNNTLIDAINAAVQMGIDSDADGGQGQEEHVTQITLDVPPNHREADLKTKDAIKKFDVMKREIDDIDAARKKLNTLVVRYTERRQLYATRLKEQFQRELIALKSDYANISLLIPGSDLLSTLPGTKERMTRNGPVNWQDKIDQLERVKSLWEKGLAIAKNRVFVLNVTDSVRDLNGQIQTLVRKVKELKRHHSEDALTPLARELRKAQRALQEALQRSKSAQELLITNDIKAKELANEANRYVAIAMTEIEDVHEEIQKLNQSKKTFEKTWNDNLNTRDKILKDIRRAAPAFEHDERFLSECMKRGDTLFNELRKYMRAPQKNYAQLSTLLNEVLEKWLAGVTQGARAQIKHANEQKTR
jgi:hypothetical protein